jgi:signal transduction histidine kinase
MDIFSLAIDHTSLAARVAEIFTLSRHLAYAQVDPGLYVQQTSPNFAAMLRLPLETVQQQPITQLLPPLQTSIPYLKEMLRGERSYFRLDYGEQNHKLPPASTTHYTLHLYCLDERDPHAGLLLILEDRTHLQDMLAQDQTELLLAQKQLAEANAELHRVNQIKSLFMSMAAHDLRTPLTTIFGFADMLLEDSAVEDEVKREILAVIRAQSERLHRLIADLLDIERIDQGQIILKSGECDLNIITGEVLESLRPLYESRNLVMDVDLPDPGLLLFGDEARIWQIMYNLVNNAVKYTSERGQVQIQIYRDEDQAVLRVADSGRGMTPDQLDRLFDLYYRTVEAKASMVLGSGLGLYIVKIMVEAHNGEVKVASELGKGTTFTVRLPLNLPDLLGSKA